VEVNLKVSGKNDLKDVWILFAMDYDSIRRVFDRLATFRSQREISSSTQALLVHDRVGRTSIPISLIQLEFVVNKFSVPKIAQQLCVSVCTIHCHVISLYLLALHAAKCSKCFKTQETSTCKAILIHQITRVQYSHVRMSQSGVGPNGSMMRYLLSLRHRSFSVSCPQYLWHIDGRYI